MPFPPRQPRGYPEYPRASSGSLGFIGNLRIPRDTQEHNSNVSQNTQPPYPNGHLIRLGYNPNGPPTSLDDGYIVLPNVGGNLPAFRRNIERASRQPIIPNVTPVASVLQPDGMPANYIADVVNEIDRPAIERDSEETQVELQEAEEELLYIRQAQEECTRPSVLAYLQSQERMAEEKVQQCRERVMECQQTLAGRDFTKTD